MMGIRGWWREAGLRLGISWEQPYPGWVLALLWTLLVLWLVSEVIIAIWP